MNFVMAPNQHSFGFSDFVEINEIADQHDMNLMDNLDHILAESVASFESIVASNMDSTDSHRLTPNGVPNPLTSSPMDEKLITYATVSPSTSYTEMSAYEAEMATKVEPTKISEMTPFVAPVCVSPSPSMTTGETPKPIVTLEPAETKKRALATKTQGISQKNSKKRRRSSTTIRSSKGASEEDEEAIQQMKRQRNRDHARASRQRKKSMTDALQRSLEELKSENAKLREQIYAVIGTKRTEQMVTSRTAAPTEKFIEALKKPENRVVDSNTLSFLQGLRHKMTAVSNKPQKIVA